jgi:hypothetical protein
MTVVQRAEPGYEYDSTAGRPLGKGIPMGDEPNLLDEIGRVTGVDFRKDALGRGPRAIIN